MPLLSGAPSSATLILEITDNVIVYTIPSMLDFGLKSEPLYVDVYDPYYSSALTMPKSKGEDLTFEFRGVSGMKGQMIPTSQGPLAALERVKGLMNAARDGGDLVLYEILKKTIEGK